MGYRGSNKTSVSWAMGVLSNICIMGYGGHIKKIKDIGELIIQNTLYIPNLPIETILSLNQFTRNNFEIIFKENTVSTLQVGQLQT